MINLARLCYGEYCLQNPQYIYFIIPLFILLVIFTWITFVKFKKDEEKKAFVKGHRFDRIFFVLIRTLIFFCLLIAIAAPYKLKESTTEGNPSLTILADNSSSFEMFDTSVAAGLAKDLEEYFPVTLKYIASGERSAIADGILENAEGDDNILVVSDGYNNYGRDLGDVILFTSMLNTTIHTLKLSPIRKDVSVTIDGPSQVIEMSDNTFKVNINNIGGVEYNKVEAFVDGNEVHLDSEGRFDWRFSRGYHQIFARILFPKDDFFEQNNIYYKSVKSLPRPKVLYISENEGPLQKSLESVYEVTSESSIPEDFASYDAVVLNNLNINKISDASVDRFANYLAEKGKGLIVVGGDNSFDQGGYKDSYFETLLPVKVGVGERRREEVYNIVFVIDLSGTVGYKFKAGSDETVLDFEKAFLANIIGSLNIDDQIAIVGFVSRSHCVPDSLHCVLTPISMIPGLESIISRLTVPAEDTGTNIALALNRARTTLEKAKGSKYIVLITDGIDPNVNAIMSSIQTMNSFGIKLYTIGVGQFVNSQLLQQMAMKGDGIYLEPDESELLKIVFMGDEEEQRCIKATSGRAVLMDTSHWITKGDLSLNANIGGYNLVVPEVWGTKLVATDCDRTLLTVGRYGLGRIAVLSTDDGSKWSGQLFSRENSKLITRMLNWAIGDYTKNKELDVRIKDTTIGKSTDVNVISNEKPDVKGLEFSKIDAGVYSAKYLPDTVGFHQIMDATVGVSYNDEYERLGMNPRLEELVAVSGGKVFDPGDVDNIKNTIISMSRRVQVETEYLRWPFVIAAIVIFLFDILFRRIRENMNIMKY
jgi:uncharacterized membrane protein